MRRLLVGMVVAAVAALVPTWALAGGQEVAEQIAANLKQSGLLHDYKIGVKYQAGTAWLRGQVASAEQSQTAERLALQTSGVTQVVNDLQTPSRDEVVAADSSSTQSLKQVVSAVSPERLPRALTPTQDVPSRGLHADRVATSFAATPAQPVGATTIQPPMLVAARPAVPQPARPIPVAYTQGAPMPMGEAGPVGGGVAPARYDQPHLPNYAWPGYAAYPNYAALTYPKQYSPTAWPYIGPFYPYPQVPLGWRKVTLEWHDGWWQLDFDDGPRRGPISGLFRPCR